MAVRLKLHLTHSSRSNFSRTLPWTSLQLLLLLFLFSLFQIILSRMDILICSVQVSVLKETKSREWRLDGNNWSSSNKVMEIVSTVVTTSVRRMRRKMPFSVSILVQFLSVSRPLWLCWILAVGLSTKLRNEIAGWDV